MITGPKKTPAEQAILDKYADEKKIAIKAQIDGQDKKISKEEANLIIETYNNKIRAEGIHQNSCVSLVK